MALTLRTTGLSPPADQHQRDYTVFQDSRPIGRLYEDLPVGRRHEVRWIWSITTVVDARWRADRGAHRHIRGSESALPGELGEMEGVG